MFRPFFLAAIVGVMIAMNVISNLALGKPSFLTGEDLTAISLFAMGWINHWIWSQDR